MLNLDRNEEGSRALILARLKELGSRGEAWVAAEDVLKPWTPKGPWSEDLQSLISEGLVECQDSVENMGNGSLIRLA